MKELARELSEEGLKILAGWKCNDFHFYWKNRKTGTYIFNHGLQYFSNLKNTHFTKLNILLSPCKMDRAVSISNLFLSKRILPTFETPLTVRLLVPLMCIKNKRPGCHRDIICPATMAKCVFGKKLPFYHICQFFSNFQKLMICFEEKQNFDCKKNMFKEYYHFIRTLHQICSFSSIFQFCLFPQKL